MLQVPGLEIGHQSKCDGREDLKENSVMVFVMVFEENRVTSKAGLCCVYKMVNGDGRSF